MKPNTIYEANGYNQYPKAELAELTQNLIDYPINNKIFKFTIGETNCYIRTRNISTALHAMSKRFCVSLPVMSEIVKAHVRVGSEKTGFKWLSL